MYASPTSFSFSTSMRETSRRAPISPPEKFRAISRRTARIARLARAWVSLSASWSLIDSGVPLPGLTRVSQSEVAQVSPAVWPTSSRQRMRLDIRDTADWKVCRYGRWAALSPACMFTITLRRNDSRRRALYRDIRGWPELLARRRMCVSTVRVSDQAIVFPHISSNCSAIVRAPAFEPAQPEA